MLNASFSGWFKILSKLERIWVSAYDRPIYGGGGES